MSRVTTTPARSLRQLVAEEPAHFFSALGIGGYAWALHGLAGAILTICAVIAAIGLTNMAIIAAGGGRHLTRFARWGWLAIILTALVLFGRPEEERDCSIPTSAFWGLPQLAFCDPPKSPAP